MKNSGLKATSLRTMLIFLLIILIGAIGYGFYFAQNQLSAFSESTIESINKSNSGIMSSDGLAAVEQELSLRSNDIEKADSFTSSSNDYQSIAIDDLTNYATGSGISIKDYSFINASEADIVPTSIDGVETKYIKININNPITSTSLIKFLKLIETNYPKMQLKGLRLDQSSDTNKINVDPLIIELYTEI